MPKKALTPALPSFVEPRKPQMVVELPEGPEWIYEIQWDGYRAEILNAGNRVELVSRNNNSLANSFPGIVAAAKELPVDCVIDGEVVALDAEGRPSFQQLQIPASTDAAIVFYAFDLLWLKGKDLRDLPFEQRRKALVKVVTDSGLRLSREMTGFAQKVLEAVGALGLEGIVAKRRDSIYV